MVKPVDGFAGTDVWLLSSRAAAAGRWPSPRPAGGRHVIVQEYLPSVDRRQQAAVPASTARSSARCCGARRDDDFRIGPPVAAAPIDAADRRIAAALAPLLVAHGIAIAGLDVIDGRLIEVNVTCPGGMHKTDALLGTDLSGAIVRRLLSSTRIRTERNSCHDHHPRRLHRPHGRAALPARRQRHPPPGDPRRDRQPEPTDPADRMYIAQRAHGNASEYIPTLAVLIVVCSALTDGWWLNALAIAALAARSLHAFGMLTAKTLAAHGPVRDTGALGTYLTGVLLGVTALVAL